MASEKTCKEYLSANASSIDNIKEKQRNRARRFNVALMIWMILLVGLFVYLFSASTNRLNRARNILVNAVPSETDGLSEIVSDIDVFSDAKAVQKYQTLFMGNTNASLLMSGDFYTDDGVTVRSENQPELINRSTEIILPNASFINVIDDVVFYRDDATRNIFTYNKHEGNALPFSAKHVGEILVLHGSMYCIDLDNNRSLIHISSLTNGASEETIFTEPVLRFGAMAERFYILYEDGQLSCYDVNQLSRKWFTINHVNNFTMIDKLYVHNGNRVLRIEYDGSRAKTILDNVDSLIGGDQDRLYFVRNDQLIAYNLLSNEEVEITPIDGICLNVHQISAGDYQITLVSFDTQEIKVMEVSVAHEN